MGDETITSGQAHLGQALEEELSPNRFESEENHGLVQLESDTDDMQANVAGALDAVLVDYDKLFKRYQRSKSKEFADLEGAIDEQSEKIAAVEKAASNIRQNLKEAQEADSAREGIMYRLNWLERAYNESQNDLILTKARALELKQELGNAQQHGGNLLHELLQGLTHLTIVSYENSKVIFTHDESGFEFKLEQNEVSKEAGGKDALLYQMVTPGTLLHRAPEWMQSEIVFDKIQVSLFFRRILAVILHMD